MESEKYDVWNCFAVPDIKKAAAVMKEKSDEKKSKYEGNQKTT